MDLGDRGLVRREGYLVQFLSLFRLSNWKGFRVCYGVQLTIVPAEDLHPAGTLRRDAPRWARLPWIAQQERELWVKWDERSDGPSASSRWRRNRSSQQSRRPSPSKVWRNVSPAASPPLRRIHTSRGRRRW